jgi:exosortase
LTSTTLTLDRPFAGDWQRVAAPAVTAGLLALLFYAPMLSTARQWWDDPDAGHGLLLAPLALYLAWQRGLAPNARPQPVLGLTLLLGAVVLRFLSGLAAELFTMRLSMFGALLALTVFYLGARQILHWWLPVTLLLLSIPLPAVILGSIAVPLQFKASQIGASLLEWRHVPVFVDGNVIRIPGRDLFVTEACSGLRSLASLIALGVLIGGLWLRTPIGRIALVLLTIPVAIALNGIRVFLTGFLVFFVDPKLGEGFMHMTEGWIIFVVAFAILGAIAWGAAQLEQIWRPAR